MNETFEQKRDRLAEEFSYTQFVYHSSEPTFLAKRGRYDGFIAGYDACREQIQADLDKYASKALELAEKYNEYVDKYLVEKAKSQKLLNALKFYQVRSNIPIKELINSYESQGPTFDILSKYTEQAYQAIAEYEAGGK